MLFCIASSIPGQSPPAEALPATAFCDGKGVEGLGRWCGGSLKFNSSHLGLAF